MHITLNKAQKEIAIGMTIQALLNQEGIDGRFLAIAVNMKIIPRNAWESWQLNDGDQVIMVGAAKGG